MSIQYKIELFRDLIYKAQSLYDAPFMQSMCFLASLNPASTITNNYNKYIKNEFDPILYDYLESNLPLLTDPGGDFDGTLFHMFTLSTASLVLTRLKDIEAVYDFMVNNRVPIYSTPTYMFWRPLLTTAEYSPEFLDFAHDLTSKLSGVAHNPAQFEAALISEIKKVLPILKPGKMLNLRNETTRSLDYVLKFSLPEILPTLSCVLTVEWFSQDTDPEEYLQGARSTLSWNNTVSGFQQITVMP